MLAAGQWHYNYHTSGPRQNVSHQSLMYSIHEALHTQKSSDLYHVWQPSDLIQVWWSDCIIHFWQHLDTDLLPFYDTDYWSYDTVLLLYQDVVKNVWYNLTIIPASGQMAIRHDTGLLTPGCIDLHSYDIGKFHSYFLVTPIIIRYSKAHQY